MTERAPQPLTHLDEAGKARMVTVAQKPETYRRAVASARVSLAEAAFTAVVDASGKKGDAIQVARIAGIMAAKSTASLIPLCHPVRLVSVAVDAAPDASAHTIELIATAVAVDRTGVEMEAMTAASVAALTLYDMVKSVDRTARIDAIRLLEKEGGKSGHFVRAPGT